MTTYADTIVTVPLSVLGTLGLVDEETLERLGPDSETEIAVGDLDAAVRDLARADADGNEEDDEPPKSRPGTWAKGVGRKFRIRREPDGTAIVEEFRRPRRRRV